jgi:hypothetical protein
MKRAILWSIVLLSASIARAAAPASQPANQAQSYAQAIAPFVDDLTVLVAHVDATNVDMDAVADYFEHLLNLAYKDPKERKQQQAGIQEMLAGPRRDLERFRKAGGRDFYFVISMADTVAEVPLFVMAPIPPGADPKALVKAVEEIGMGGVPAGRSPIGTPKKAALIRGAAVGAVPPILERLAAMEPSGHRPQLTAGFDAAAGTDAQILLTPSADTRRVLAAMLPMGAGPQQDDLRAALEPVVSGLVWASVGIKMPPGLSIKVTIQAEDPKTAQAVEHAATRYISRDIERGEAAGNAANAGVEQVLRRLVPEVRGDRLIETLDAGQIDALIEKSAPSLILARQQAKRYYAMNNICQFGRGMQIFYAMNNRWPDDIRQIVEVAMRMPYDENMDVLKNPQRPDMKPAYIYLKPAMPVSKIEDPGKMVFMYEHFDAWNGGIAVGWLDGHADFIADQEQFEKALAHTKAQNAAWLMEVAATQKAGAK